MYYKTIKCYTEILYKRTILWTIKGINNLILYFKTIWLDRDYDYFFILKILKFKIEKTIQFHEKYSYNIYNIQRMKLTVKLIDKILNDDYLKELINVTKHNDKDIILNYLNKNKNILIRNKVYFNESEPVGSLVGKVVYLYDYKTDKTYDLIFKVLQHNMRNWWI
ncbi:MAG: hypothetical protein QXL18_05070 [Candidatus Woesearchaeota archaeon]